MPDRRVRMGTLDVARAVQWPLEVITHPANVDTRTMASAREDVQRVIAEVPRPVLLCATVERAIGPRKFAALKRCVADQSMRWAA